MARKLKPLTLKKIVEQRRALESVSWYGNKPGTASIRYASGQFMDIRFRPKFLIDPEKPVFTIGSCFARNVESSLIESGFNVVTAGLKLEQSLYTSVHTLPNAVLNVYNTHSIENRIRAFLGDEETLQGGLYALDGGLFWDALATHTRPNEVAIIEQTRQQLKTTIGQIKACGTVIITLGLNEVWFDLETGTHLNQAPPVQVLKHYPKRFAVDFPDVRSNVASLERLFGLIHEANPNDVRIILTVSPVPLGETFLEDDVIVANMQSKSVLRVAAREISERFDFVDYFPSYEMVMTSPHHLVWEDDSAHVRREAVQQVVSRFISSYIKTADEDANQEN